MLLIIKRFTFIKSRHFAIIPKGFITKIKELIMSNTVSMAEVSNDFSKFPNKTDNLTHPANREDVNTIARRVIKEHAAAFRALAQ
jgi:hypothetical protein